MIRRAHDVSDAGGSAVAGRARPDLFRFSANPANQPSDERARHLADVHIPMLFVQGTRDALADPGLLLPLVDALGIGVTLRLLDQADHSFHVPVRSGQTDAQVVGEALDGAAAWIRRILAMPSSLGAS